LIVCCDRTAFTTLHSIDNPKNPREYLGKFWLDSLVHDPVMLKVVVDLVGADKVILGTDYPFPLGDVYPWFKPGHLIEEGPFTGTHSSRCHSHTCTACAEEQKDKMLGLNACEFLGVDPSIFERK
jgi:aminocarboxymuconate-semialdehyde decarboxylase